MLKYQPGNRQGGHSLRVRTHTHPHRINDHAIDRAVGVMRPTISYTATCGSFDVSVTSELLGALGSNPGSTGVMRDTLVFTNNNVGPLDLESVSRMDQDLIGSSNDMVEFDAATQAVFATDSVDAAPDKILWAAIANTDCSGSTFGYHVDVLGDETQSFPMDNGIDPVGPGDTAMAIGHDCGSIAPGASVTFTYEYLFSTKLSSVPTDFGQESRLAGPPQAIPALPLGGLAGIVVMILFLGGPFGATEGSEISSLPGPQSAKPYSSRTRKPVICRRSRSLPLQENSENLKNAG